jgi:hypothetical protein
MPTLTTPAVIGLVLALLFAGLLGYLTIRAWRKIYHSPRMVLGRLGQRRLSDLVLPDGMEGEIHVDHLLLTPHGILVLELRNASGALFAGENLDEWRVIDQPRRYSFRNPLPGLEARIHAVEVMSGKVPVLGRVAIVGDVQFTGGRLPRVATLAEVAEEFQAGRGRKERKSTPEEYLEAWERIRHSVRPATT